MAANHARAFSWNHPAVYPLWGAVGTGLTFAVYVATRKLFGDPTVFLNRTLRQEMEPAPDREDVGRRYRSTNLFAQHAAWRAEHGHVTGWRDHKHPAPQH